jgi:phage anti-repressor protein/phage antirepressor YoqD-like protein
MQNNDSGNDLIKLHQRAISGAQVPTVNARQLHSFLEVGKDFSNWVKDRIDAFGFVEGQDYVIVETLSSPNLASSKSRAQTTKEYFLTIDMAKELSMVERNDKGKQARRYFINCERRMMDGATPPMTREQLLARAVLESQEVIAEKDAAIGRLTVDNANLQEDRQALNKIAVADGSLDLTVTAKTLQMSRKELIRIMTERQWIYQRHGVGPRIGYQSKINAGSLEHKVSTVSLANGSDKTISQVRVTPKGITELAKIISKYRSVNSKERPSSWPDQQPF